MKKIVTLGLVLFMLLGTIACGSNEKKAGDAQTAVNAPEVTTEPEATKSPKEAAFDLSKEAYGNINTAYDILSAASSDIYEAWRVGIYDASNLKKLITNGKKGDAAQLVANALSLPEEQFYAGLKTDFFSRAGVALSGPVYEMMDEKSKASLADLIKSVEEDPDFALYSAMNKDALFASCVMAVIYAYQENGVFEVVETLLGDAKQEMKQMSAQFSDYEHYPNLKGFFTNTSALFDYCKSPEGSFEQAKDTINEYRNNARKYKNDLDYLFED